MSKYHRIVRLCVAVVGCILPLSAAGVTYESAQFGGAGATGGAAVGSNVMLGWRFEIDSPLEVRSVAGHLFDSQTGGSIFAAILRLDSVTAVPHGSPFTLDELVAATTFTPPSPSFKTFVPLVAPLTPGAYALVFGSGFFGASGSAAMPNPSDQPNLPPTTSASYMAWYRPIDDQPPRWVVGTGDRLYFAVIGASADFDRNGVADGADFLAWQRGIGGTGTLATGDSDGNQIVDSLDLAVWKTQFGGGSAPIGAAVVDVVPEPAGAALTAIGLLFLAQSATHRRPPARIRRAVTA